MSEIDFLKSLRKLLRSKPTGTLLEYSQSKMLGTNILINEDIVSREDHMEAHGSSKDNHLCDVLIITPTVKELRMTALAFDKDYETPEKNVKNLPVFEFDLERTGKLSALKVVICTINRQRNVWSGPKTGTKIDEYKPRLVVLTGIAGTRVDKELGEVAGASGIIYTAGGVETQDGKKVENDPIECDEFIYNLMHRYEELREKKTASDEFRKDLIDRIKSIDGLVPPAKELSKYKPKFSVKKLMSGEVLRRDGGFTEQAKNIDRSMTMVEMEAAGFAIACKERGLNWMVFRGSCDFADHEKDDRWQRVAALSAGLSVRHCIKHLLIFEEEMRY